MKHFLMSVAAMTLVGACAQSPFAKKPGGALVAGSAESEAVRPAARPEGMSSTQAVKPPSGARTAAQLDTTSNAEKKAAVVAAQEAAASGDGKALGSTVASLGDPTEPGLWIKTPLVSSAAKGRVVYPKNGKAVELDLLPLDGPKTGGSRMSLAALRVIEAPLTDLPTVEVFLN